MPKLSVVIPVYNVEKYLPKCVDSVINQTLKDIEIILVNDGSTDNSGEICEKYTKADDRIKYICQDNQGVAAARKKGTEYVTSDYVTFIDSDDWVSESFFEELYNNINGCDIVLSNYYRVQEDKITIIKNELSCDIYNTPEKMKYIVDNMMYAPEKNGLLIIASICGKLFKTEIVRKIFDGMDKNVYYGEDHEFFFKYILKCRSLNCTDIYGYYYFSRENSCVNSNHDTFLLNLNNLYNSLLKAFKENEHSESLIKQLQLYIIHQCVPIIPKTMGFHPECIITRYISPFLNKIEGKRTALYGAGDVGKNYYLQMKKSNGDTPAIWVDRNYELYNEYFPVHSIEELKNENFDYIIIAIESEATAMSIKNNLIEMGFEEGIILWEKPIKLY